MNAKASSDTGSPTRASRSLSVRALRWSLAGCCAALLWVAGYFGGRSAGYDAGQDEGFAAGQALGYERSLELLAITQQREGVFDVGPIIDERLPPPTLGTPWNQAAVDAELQKLVSEVQAEVHPEVWKDPKSGCNIDGLSSNLVIVVTASPRVVAEVGAYLTSKDEYLAWKQASPQPR